MKKSIFLTLFSSFIFLVGIAQVNIQWQTRYTSAGSNIDKAEDMVVDASGNVYVTGIGRGASGGFDYITIKYNSLGVQQWKSEFNGVGNGLDEAHAVAIDGSGNVYVTGWSNSGATKGFDYVTVKYNSAGAQQWATSYNGAANGTDEAWDIGVDNAGNVYVTGSSDGSAGNNSAATTVKYNSAGVQQNVVRYDGAGGANGIDAGFALYVDPATGITYVTGYTYTSTNADFDFLILKYTNTLTQTWARVYDGPDGNYDEARAITVDASGFVYVTGYSQTAVLTNYNYLTVKCNNNGTGNVLWAKSYNGTGDDYDRANAIKLDASKNVYVTGRSIGANSDAEDIVTIKYNNGGTQKWTARYSGSPNGYDEGNALDIDASGNIYVAGYSYASASNNDYIIIKYDSTGIGSNGNQLWIAKYNGTGNNNDQAAGIGIDAGGNIYTSGQSRGVGSNDDYATVKFCQLTANAGLDTVICKGASFKLKASAIGAVSYVWTPATGLSSTTIFNPVATPTITTTYVVSITNGTGCVDTDTLKITVVPLPMPVITANGPTTFCKGDSVKLTVTKDTSYVWNTSSTLQTITARTSGTYTVTVTNGIGCTGSASKVVTVNLLPTIDAGLHKNNCIGSSINLKATGGNSYVWHNGNSLNDSTISNPIANPVITTTYTVIGIGANTCVNTDTVSITVLPIPSIDAGSNQNVCKGLSVNLLATGGSTYVWHSGKTLNDSTIANPVATPLSITKYIVIGKAVNGCTNKDSVIVVALALPIIDGGLDDSICIGGTLNLLASGGISYIWNPGILLDDSTIYNPVTTPLNTTVTYTVSGTDANGCKNKDIVKIVVFPYPTIDAGLDDSVCITKSIQLKASGGLSYTWHPGNTLSDSTIFNPKAGPTSITTYTVVGIGPGGCSSSDVVKIKTLSNPIIDAGLDGSVCIAKGIQLQASGGISYVWHPGYSLSDSTIFNPKASPTNITTYTVVGTSQNGCMSSDAVKITILPSPSIPTIYRGNDTLYCNQTAPTYQWYKDGLLIPGANKKYYVYTLNGMYNVEVSNVAGCTTASTTINIAVSVEEIDGLKLLSIYPNPATNNLNIELSISKASNLKINLTTISGQVLFSDNMSRFAGVYKKQIDLDQYTEGIYFLQIITNNQVITKKVVKQ